MTPPTPRWLALVLAALLLAACGGGAETDAPAATATPAPTAATTAATAKPTAEATPAPFADAEFGDPDVERAWEDLRVLAVEIGVRAAGSEAEREAAEFIASRLREAGYVVTIEAFETTYRGDHSTVGTAGEGPSVQAIAMGESRNGEATAPLVHAGLGAAEDFEDVDAAGAIALLDRGVVRFSEKALNAQQAGAVAVVVVNNEPRLFGGTLGEDSGVAIPVVGVSGQAREALLALAADGAAVTVTADVSTRTAASSNVVGRGADGECRAYLGAHYDSVPYGPGAHDNASGTALMIELARTHRAAGLCVVAFGAEEVGLLGSIEFTERHDVSDAVFMLNFDMAARIGTRTFDGPRFVRGDPALAERAAAVASAVGYGIPAGDFPPNAGSDHVSFERARVPAVTLYSGGSEFIHTSGDTIDTVFREDLAIMLEVSAAVLRELLAAGGG